MRLLELLLLAMNAVSLLALAWGRAPRGFGYLPTVVAGLTLADLLLAGFCPLMTPLYLTGGLLFLLTRGRLRALRRPARIRRALRIAGGALGLLALGLATVITSAIPNYAGRGWAGGFAALHAELRRSYAFGDWKGIDWDGLYAAVAPQVAAAEATGDRQAYYLALRSYAFALPDGHVGLLGADDGARAAAIGGGYGFALIGLDDGRHNAHVILPDGPAERAGMGWGAEILALNDRPVASALADVSTMWVDAPPATAEGRRLAQQRLLTRAPIGAQVSVTFRNPGGQPVTALLTAVDDQLAGLEAARLTPPAGPLDSPVQARIMPGGQGYLRITSIGPTLGGFSFRGLVRAAIADFVANDVPAVIIDVRGNAGGADDLAAYVVGFFASERVVYEGITGYNSATRHHELEHTLYIEPQTPHYAGPVIVLVDGETRSSGEGIPMAIQRLPQGRVVGVSGTHGSFGMANGLAQLPGGYLFVYPRGQSLDARGRIQLDSDRELRGGVVPDIRVPLTAQTVRAMYAEGRDVALELAVRTARGQSGAP